VLKAGANLIVSPNVNADAIVMAVAGGAVSLLVVMTPSERFAALDAGASGLKCSPAVCSAMLASSPSKCKKILLGLLLFNLA